MPLYRVTDAGDHWYMDLDDMASGWQTAASLPDARNHLSGATVGNLIYALGGQFGHDAGTDDLDLVDSYDFTTDTWTRVQSLPTDRSHFEPGTSVHNNKIFIAGGRNQDLFLDDVLVYDPATDTWAEVCKLPENTLAPVSKIIGSQLIIANGGLGHITNTTDRSRYIIVEGESTQDISFTESRQSKKIQPNLAKVYPNPTMDSFNATLLGEGEVIETIIMVDMVSGKQIQYIELQGEEIINIDFNAAPSGAYIVKMLTSKGNQYTKTLYKL